MGSTQTPFAIRETEGITPGINIILGVFIRGNKETKRKISRESASRETCIRRLPPSKCPSVNENLLC